MRIIAGCLWLLLPALLIVMCIEAVPLQNPGDGWKANGGAWVRFVMVASCICVGIIVQINQLVPALALSVLEIASSTFSTVICYTGSMLVLAIYWAYPIPFGTVVGTQPFIFFMATSFLVTVGRKRFQSIPDLAAKLKKQLYIIFAQAILAMVYPIFSALYYLLPPNYKVFFVLLLPCIRFAMKHVVVWFSSDLEDYQPGIVVFSVGVFNALYTSKCMQSSGSKATYVVIIAIDIVESVIAYRDLHKSTLYIRSLLEKIDAANTKRSLLDQLVSLSQEPDVFLDRVAATIRLRSPIEIPMSAQSTGRLSRIASHPLVVFKDQPLVLERQSQLILAASGTNTAAKSSSSSMFRLSTRVSPIEVQPRKEGDRSSEKRTSQELTTQRTERDSDAALADKRELMRVALKLLFKCEFHALVEFIECAVPTMYAIYVLVLYQLPSAKYYPEMRDMTSEQMHSMVSSIVIYAFFEGLSFLAMHYTVKWRCGVSPACLLGFVVKNQCLEFQGRLLVWYTYVLQLTLDHFGTFSLL